MKEYLNNNIKRIKIARNYEEIVYILFNMEQYLLSLGGRIMELQEVYTGDLEDSILSNSTITDNIISIDKDSPTETIIPSTAVDTTIPLTETTTSTKTTTPLTPLNLNIKHSIISIWKQEYISSISNLLADLNDLITVENSMNRLT
ncbi:unnamed protein product [Rhizophagus irregularis]|uniref:Uncharacterized protein n=1 Tax=Rhizophagus irregularis TaxID=588596 RepID=A0A915Z7X7_9GLOM|nr:unnamed protein product [Rhizophagus irregularis]